MERNWSSHLVCNIICIKNIIVMRDTFTWSNPEYNGHDAPSSPPSSPVFTPSSSTVDSSPYHLHQQQVYGGLHLHHHNLLHLHPPSLSTHVLKSTPSFLSTAHTSTSTTFQNPSPPLLSTTSSANEVVLGVTYFKTVLPRFKLARMLNTYIELAQLGQMKHMHQHSKHSDDFGTHNILCQHLRPFRHVCAYYQLISVFDADFHHSNGFRCRMKTVKGQVAEESVGFHRGWETETTIL